MKLVRNIFTELICAIFLVIFGYIGYQIVLLTIVNSPNLILTNILVIIGLLIFLIAAYLLKNKALWLIEKNNVITVIVEILIVIVVEMSLWSSNDLEELSLVLSRIGVLFFIYFSSRLAGGRLCGVVSILTGQIFMLDIRIERLERSEYLLIATFLIAWCISLLIIKFDVRTLKMSGFLYFVCLFGAIVYTFCMIINPMVIVIFLSSFVSLFPGGRKGSHSGEDKESETKSNHGIRYAVSFHLFVPISCVVGNIVFCRLKRLSIFEMPVLERLKEPFFLGIDSGFQIEMDFNQALDYIILKIDALTGNIYSLINSGSILIIVLFFSTMAGMHMLMKKYSFMRPLAMSFTGMFAIYILFARRGSDFSYFYILTPVFTGYGFSNLLIHNSMEEPKYMRKKINKENKEKKRLQGKIQEKKKITAESEEKGQEVNDFMKILKWSKKKENGLDELKDKTKNSDWNTSRSDNLYPEWKLSGASEVKSKVKSKEAVQPEVVEKSEKPIQPEVVENQEEMDSINVVEDVVETKVSESSDFLGKIDDNSFGDVSTIKPEIELSKEEESYAELDVTGNWGEAEETDLGDIVSRRENDEEESLEILSSERVQEKEKEKGDLGKEVFSDSANIELGAEDGEHDLAQFLDHHAVDDMQIEVKKNEDVAVPDSEEKVRSNDTEESLNQLFERLDLSDNIRRMNETAQEDMAEVIEKTSINKDLDNAIPAEDMKVISQESASSLDKEEEEDSKRVSLEDLISDEPIPMIFERVAIVPPSEQGNLVINPSTEDAKEILMPEVPLELVEESFEPLSNEMESKTEETLEALNHNEVMISEKAESRESINSDDIPSLEEEIEPELYFEQVIPETKKMETLEKSSGVAKRTYHRIIIK